MKGCTFLRQVEHADILTMKSDSQYLILHSPYDRMEGLETEVIKAPSREDVYNYLKATFSSIVEDNEDMSEESIMELIIEELKSGEEDIVIHYL